MQHILSFEETMSGGDEAGSTQTNRIIKKPIQWSLENEEILVEWGDIAQCYKWLTTRCYLSYCNYHAWFTIPTIIFSTITGTAIFAQLHVSAKIQLYIQVSTGFINISIGILTTLLQYLRIAELKELYKNSSLGWDKLARNIRIELAKTPYERNDANHFIKLCRQEFNRLMETTPLIDEATMKQFFKTFAGNPGSQQREEYDMLKKPDICDELVSIDKNRKHWFININEYHPYTDEDVKELTASQHKRAIIPSVKTKFRRASTLVNTSSGSPEKKRKKSNTVIPSASSLQSQPQLSNKKNEKQNKLTETELVKLKLQEEKNSEVNDVEMG